MALKFSPAGGALNGDVVAREVPDLPAEVERDRQFVVRPRGSDRVFLVRRLTEMPAMVPQVWGFPTFCAIDADGCVQFYPKPSLDYQVFELVPVEAAK